MKIRDLSNQKFGKLTVLSRFSKKNKSWWNCRCDCGKEKPVQAAGLLRGSSKSCGCNKKRKPRIHATQLELNKHSLFRSYRDRAKHKGFSFSIDKDIFFTLVALNCYYCNFPPKNTYRYKSSDKEPFLYSGLDRIDNEIGYELSNCVPCCRVCNYVKGQYLTKEELINIISQRIKKDSDPWYKFRGQSGFYKNVDSSEEAAYGTTQALR